MAIRKLTADFSLERDRIEILKQLIPEVVADGKIDWDVLKESLSEYLEDEGERAEHFGLNWPGKRQARRLASIPSQGTLVPVPGDGIDEDTTGNIFIEGDNLEVLKLLQKSYAGKVKLIYIDPPYNTGNDFIYSDDFREPTADYLKKTGQADEEGKLLTSNPKAGGRFHSNWLNMMYPRLKLARNLLRDDGVIFISIDDNEMQHLRSTMDEIFGEENFIATFVWQKMDSPSRNDPLRAVTDYHEYIVLYAKDKSASYLKQKKNSDILEGYNIQLADGKIGRRRQLRKNGKSARREDRPTLWYPLIAPDESVVYPTAPEGWEGRWVLSEETWKERSNQGLTDWIKRDYGWVPYYIEIAPIDPSTPWSTLLTDVAQNRQAKAEFTSLMGSEIHFDNPKPTSLLKVFLKMSTFADDLCLDFFAGSCSIAQAIMELNEEDNGDRNYILVQVPERLKLTINTNITSFARTIPDIGRERIRKAIIKIKQERKIQSILGDLKQTDLGFKSYKFDRSNLKIWKDYEGDDVKALQQELLASKERLVAGWTEEKVVAEIQLLEGFTLDSNIKIATEFTKNRVTCVSSERIGYRLLICLSEKLDISTVQDVRFLEDEDVFICLDGALTDEYKLMLADGCNVKTI